MRITNLQNNLEEFKKLYGDLEVTVGYDLFIETLEYDSHFHNCKLCGYDGDIDEQITGVTKEHIKAEHYDDIKSNLEQEIYDEIYDDLKDEICNEIRDEAYDDIKNEIFKDYQNEIKENYELGFYDAIIELKEKGILPKNFDLKPSKYN